MARIAQEAIDYQIKRFLRPDWRRFWKPGHENDPLFQLYESAERKYRPDQLRDDWGRFADEGRRTARSNRVHLASSDKPNLGRHALIAIFAEAAKRAMDAYRSENGLRDLFGRHDGTVSYLEINGKDVFGSNSTAPSYTSSDRAATDKLRDTLLNDFPDKLAGENIGQMPNNALYHAETNALLRAAKENGGTLAGQTLNMRVDSPMCTNCEEVLPLVGLELGNPTVTIVDSRNVIRTMRDGRWIEKVRP